MPGTLRVTPASCRGRTRDCPRVQHPDRLFGAHGIQLAEGLTDVGVEEESQAPLWLLP